ncbi:hypothetical protein JQ597_04510 [Bradyrhizobium sp. AUGA SZCCT0177]|uniref:hypothetical protein n=1 Tax=Bradyrhizobium sp. AUGA SZCCT0177 TaxID=2807665 RepID=UPI001BA96767|nr:hypothetical protein [Bradyrhizobium sp. AUGA SZCCT0177]MBR1281297.1 hypothetical protein [Bradyrhizobium sp. AUGA SZCCT0177]
MNYKQYTSNATWPLASSEAGAVEMRRNRGAFQILSKPRVDGQRSEFARFLGWVHQIE